MSAWFALTQGRYQDTITAAQAGQQIDRGHSVHAQLIGQEAKARARMRDVEGLAKDLDRGRQILSRLPQPERADHHFVVDPTKWDFYAMDAFRLAGDDARSEEHARLVLEQSATRDGIDRFPMRMSEVRLTLATIASRAGDLEQASDLGLRALNGRRRSLPSLLMVAGELDSELQQRYPHETATQQFREALRTIG